MEEERKLIAYFLEQADHGYTVSEIARDLLVRGTDKDLVDKVLQEFAKESQPKDPLAAQAEKEFHGLKDRYELDREMRAKSGARLSMSETLTLTLDAIGSRMSGVILKVFAVIVACAILGGFAYYFTSLSTSKPDLVSTPIATTTAATTTP